MSQLFHSSFLMQSLAEWKWIWHSGWYHWQQHSHSPWSPIGLGTSYRFVHIKAYTAKPEGMKFEIQKNMFVYTRSWPLVCLFKHILRSYIQPYNVQVSSLTCICEVVCFIFSSTTKACHSCFSPRDRPRYSHAQSRSEVNIHVGVNINTAESSSKWISR